MSETIGFNLNYEDGITMCAYLRCEKKELAKVLKAIGLKEKDSKYYRELGSTVVVEETKFDIDNWLLTHSPAQILTMRANALAKPKFTLASEDPDYVKS